MLILCSNGLSRTKLQAYAQQYLANCKKAALVVTADNVYKENNYDVVEFIGGNPFYLLHSIHICQAKDILQTIANEKILIGWSAAAFVFGPTLELVNTYSPEMNLLSLTDLAALALTDLEVLPHYNKFTSRFERFEERCREYEKIRKINVIRLNDGDGLFIWQSTHLLIRA